MFFIQFNCAIVARSVTLTQRLLNCRFAGRYYFKYRVPLLCLSVHMYVVWPVTLTVLYLIVFMPNQLFYQNLVVIK